MRYQGKVSRVYCRADAAFAMPGVYEYLEAERIKYAIRIPNNQVLQDRIGYLLKRPVERPPNEVRRESFAPVRKPVEFKLSQSVTHLAYGLGSRDGWGRAVAAKFEYSR
jgi:Transposase DDE domain group 1